MDLFIRIQIVTETSLFLHNFI